MTEAMALNLRIKVLEAMPRVLSLLDKNPYSKTYGSFDRKYWHYKIIDFPCGMMQELALPLAYVFSTAFEGNKYYRLPRIREFLTGIFRYHQISAHKDGSLDDYFPYERAYGATAYALAALTEAALMGDLCPKEVIDTFGRSGNFLSQYREPGKISNHLAIAALALTNLYLLTKNERWIKESAELVCRLQSQQHDEGWFCEYEGCDLGYQTVTVEFLARKYKKVPDERILGMLSKNLSFLVNFMHPDGSFGGEYGSRNTYNFYPGGFAILSTRLSEAVIFLENFFKGLKQETCNYPEDDGIFSHLLSSYVTVLQCAQMQSIGSREEGVLSLGARYFPGAGLFSGRAGAFDIFGNTTKGGVYKIFKSEKLLNSDTGFMGVLDDGRVFCQNVPFSSQGYFKDNKIVINGNFFIYRTKLLTRLQMIFLRGFSLVFNRSAWYSKLIRIAMQMMLIYGRKKLPVRFLRTITVSVDEITVTDEIMCKRGTKINALKRTTDCVSMHVITSNSFQLANLLSWENINIDSTQGNIRIEKRYR